MRQKSQKTPASTAIAIKFEVLTSEISLSPLWLVLSFVKHITSIHAPTYLTQVTDSRSTHNQRRSSVSMPRRPRLSLRTEADSEHNARRDFWISGVSAFITEHDS